MDRKNVRTGSDGESSMAGIREGVDAKEKFLLSYKYIV